MTNGAPIGTADTHAASRDGDRAPVLVFGATGQIGWELVRALAPLSPVVAAGRMQADFTDLESLAAYVQRVAPSLVVNAAAFTNVAAAEREPAVAARVNTDAPRALAIACARRNVPFVHYSTDYVFDGTSSVPYAEDAQTAPLGVYGRTKRDGEEAIRAVGGAHLVLRTSWVYGVRGQNFMRTILRLAHTQPTLRVVADQRGAPTWSRAVAESTAVMLAQLRDPHGGGYRLEAARAGVYHIAAGGETTWYDFARAILAADPARATQRCGRVDPVTAAEYGGAVTRPAYSVLATGRALAEFGIRLPRWDAQFALVADELAHAATPSW